MTTTIKENATISVFPLNIRSGLEELLFQVLSGSEVKFTLYSEGPGTVELKIYNSFSTSIPYREIRTLVLNGPGFQDFIVNDFHNYFKLELISSNQKNSVGVSVRQDSKNSFNSNQEILNELNRLVPEYYDDVEVLSETPKKQPIDIQFRLKGENIRTIRITYVNEIFKRVQVL